MKFNLDSYKSNKAFLLVLLVLVVSLIAINSLFLNTQPTTAQLTAENGEIQKLIISEIMTSNKGIINDPTGNTYDWLEIYNGSPDDINLTNYGLSDKDDGSVQWLFPNVIIKSNSYLVVYLTGEKMDGLYANFSLKQDGGELITLKNSAGKVVDSVKTLAIEKNTTMIRESSGEWVTTEDITPGYANTPEGRLDYLNSYKGIEAPTQIVLSEFLPSNEGNILFEDKLYSYIEVTNTSDEKVNLHDYYLSNDEKAPFKWRLPEVELDPNSSYLVYTNEKNKDNNASFRLKSKTGKVLLSYKNNVVETVEYEDLTKGVAYVKTDGVWHQGNNISPGYPNTTQGMVEFADNVDISPQNIVINEVMSSNSKYLPQNGNQYYDWIELYNNSNSTINLSNYTISTDYDDNKMYQLPNVNVGPHQYYIIMASGDTSLSGTYKHTNFKLSSGKGVFLFKEGNIVDTLFIYSIPKGSSYGRGTSGHYYYTTPTPGKVNEQNGLRAISYKPEFDKEGGIYNDVSTLEIKINSSGAVYYTTDGSVPNTNSTKYTEPIKLNKTTVVRAVSYESNKKNSEVVTQSYIINENHTLPVLSVSLPQESFSKLNARTFGRTAYQAHAELYEKDSSFSLDCGLKLFGNQSRMLPKKSYQLKFNSKYGHSLNYKVFDDKDIREFNTLVLRGGSQQYKKSLFKDEIISTMLVRYSDTTAQAAKPIILYINGKYWGIYFIREKIDDDFIEKNYNVSGGKTNISTIEYVDWSGSKAPFQQITSYVLNHDMTKKENYDYVKTKIDMNNYLDAWATHFYIYNTDLHNFRYYNNTKLDNGRIKAIVYDTDYAFFFNYGSRYFSYIQNPQAYVKTRVKGELMRGLMKSPYFKKEFAKRILYNIGHVWTEKNMLDTFNYFYNAVEPEMKREAARWGSSYDTWKKEALSLKNKMLKRRNEAINITKNHFNLTQEEVNDYLQ